MHNSWPLPHDREKYAIAMERWQALGPPAAKVAADAEGSAMLAALFGNSPFLTQAALAEPAFVTELWQSGVAPAVAAEFAELRELHRGLSQIPPLETIASRLRRAKRRIALACAIADVSGRASLEDVTALLSDFASLATGIALDSLLLRFERDGAWQLDGRPDAAGLTVLGMGKLGAGELNYSSDIDLIVLYDREAPAIASDDGIGTKFVRLTRQLVQLLSDITADGYVFRTDLRLRPDPGSTPLAISTAAAETYYESVGQNWERAAMIKARPIAGALAVGEAFLGALRPYIWRRHLDFAAIADIHSIKRQINAHRGGASVAVAGHDIKLGRGGIREVEFFVQTQQLIFGGRLPQLRLRGTCAALRELAAAGLVENQVAVEMESAYRFLRRLEHRLQMVDDRQTHRLPDSEAGISAIATFLGYPSTEAFTTELLAVLRTVELHYARLFEEAPALGTAGGDLVFTGTDDDPATLESLRRLGFRDPAVTSGVVRRWHHGRYRCTATGRARELLTELMPKLLQALAASANPDRALLHFDRFLANLPAGVQPFSLFKAQPPLLELVTAVLGSAPRVGSHLASRPILLDAVLSSDFYSPYPDPGTLAGDLQRLLAPLQNEQDVLDVARRWTNDQRLRIAVHQLKGLMSPRDSFVAYADLAAAVISELTASVCAAFEMAHGGFGAPSLAVVALGKLGSREMTATSDLDLMFVYDIEPGREASDGARPLAPIQYYTRLSQKIIGALTAITNEGALFEVDMRLRPSGNAGPLACSLEAFETYQRESAWTWEHQALTRARVLCGPAGVVTRLESTIRDTLCRPRDAVRLLRDVADMRDRIAEHVKPKSLWDFKYVRGGLFDIDFCVQYLALREAPGNPAILHPNIAEMLQRLAALGTIGTTACSDLIATHGLLLGLQGLMRLCLDGQEAGFNEDDAPDGLLRLLIETAGVADMAGLRAKVLAATGRAYEIYCEIVARPAIAAGFVPRSER